MNNKEKTAVLFENWNSGKLKAEDMSHEEISVLVAFALHPNMKWIISTATQSAVNIPEAVALNTWFSHLSAEGMGCMLVWLLSDNIDAAYPERRNCCFIQDIVMKEDRAFLVAKSVMETARILSNKS